MWFCYFSIFEYHVGIFPSIRYFGILSIRYNMGLWAQKSFSALEHHLKMLIRPWIDSTFIENGYSFNTRPNVLFDPVLNGAHGQRPVPGVDLLFNGRKQASWFDISPL